MHKEHTTTSTGSSSKHRLRLFIALAIFSAIVGAYFLASTFAKNTHIGVQPLASDTVLLKMDTLASDGMYIEFKNVNETADLINGYINPKIGINIGVPEGTELKEVGPNADGEYVVSQDNIVLDGLKINACVEVQAKNVVIKNSHLICNTNQRGLYTKYPVDSQRGASVRLERNKIECVPIPNSKIEPCPDNGIQGANVTAIRNEILNVSDGFNPSSGSWLIKENYVHSQAYACVTYQPDKQNHADAIQSFGATTVVEGNVFEGWKGSNTRNECGPSGNKGFAAIYASKVSFNGNVTPYLTIRNNLFTKWHHNALYCGVGAQCTVNNNYFEKIDLSTRQFTIRVDDGLSTCNYWEDGTLIEYKDNYQESISNGC